MDVLEKAFAPMLRPIIERMEATGKVPPDLQAMLDEIKTPTKAIGALLGQSLGAGATGGIISSTLGPSLLLLQYEIQRLTDQARWDPMIAAAIHFRRPDLEDLARSDLRDQGWTMERFEAFIDAAMTRLKEDDYVILRFRFGLSKEEYAKHMYELGYTPERAEDFYKTRLFYPTPADLVRWQAREVFEPEMRERYGLDAELGQVERDAFYRAGMTDEQITNYWRAHWEHASWVQVTEMLHRGQLTEAEIWDWFRLVEIPPFWRDKLIKIAYMPYTRVDVRRMHKFGTLDREGVKRAYLDHGFDDERAEKMTEFTVAYNAGEDRDLTKSDILSAYRKGDIDELVARELLAEIDYGPDEIDFYLTQQAQVESTRQRDLTLANWRQLYQLGIVEKSAATAAMAELGYDQKEIAHLFALWTIEAPPRVSKPSRTDLEHFLKANIINTDTWRREMGSLGYSEKYIGWYHQEITGELEET